MDTFLTDKFGSDNSSCKQDSKTLEGKQVSTQELINLMEKTLERQRMTNEAVYEEEDDVEENQELEELDELSWDYPDYSSENAESFEEQIDPRWETAEYFLIDEAVDWESLESDSKQLFIIGNSKVGQDTIIFNLQPARFCPSLENGMCKLVKPVNGQFKISCYALADERQYKPTLQLHLRQMRFWDTHTAEEIYQKLENFYYDKKIRGGSLTYATVKAANDKKTNKPATKAKYAKVKTVKLKYIRFNQSGDLKDVADAIKMDKVAQLAKDNLNLISYSYTARKDILQKYKFNYVHIQGSGFEAISAINKPILGKSNKKFIGKTFTAFPSLYNKNKKLQERLPNITYYEDIFEEKTPDGKNNPHFNKYSLSNKSGWYPCPGDCNSCPACKNDDFKNIACKIHRLFQKMNLTWHDVEEVGMDEYRVHQKFDPYKKDEQGKTVWSEPMETEYETNAKLIQKEKNFNKLPKQEQVEFLTLFLLNLYQNFDPTIKRKDLDEDEKKEFDKDKAEISLWELKAKKRDINVDNLRKQAGMST